MNKLTLAICVAVLIGCNNKPTQLQTNTTSDSVVDSVVNDTVLTPLEKAEQMLETSNGLESKIQQVYKSKEVLASQNTDLVHQLQVVKDSLISKEVQLKEVIKKLPKKKNLIEKVLHIGPDSIEVVEVIQVEQQ